MTDAHLEYAIQDGHAVYIEDFHCYRGRSDRPRNLTCPECEKSVMMKLSPACIVQDHFAHYPNSDCPLRDGGESARHLNAKMKLAAILRLAKSLTVQAHCHACGKLRNLAAFPEFDSVLTEMKIQSRRPDIALFRQGVLAGCVEIYHQCRMNQERIEDMARLGVPWFEISALGVEHFASNPMPPAAHLIVNAFQAKVTAPRYSTHCDECKKADQEKAAMINDPAFWESVRRQTRWQVAEGRRDRKPEEEVRQKCDDLIAMIHIGSEDAMRQMDALFTPPAGSDFAFLLSHLAGTDRAGLIKSAAVGVALGLSDEEASIMAVTNYLKRRKTATVPT